MNRRTPPHKAESIEIDGKRFLEWECDRCGEQVQRRLAWTPWYCTHCGYHDRDVELDADEIASVGERDQS